MEKKSSLLYLSEFRPKRKWFGSLLLLLLRTEKAKKASTLLSLELGWRWLFLIQYLLVKNKPWTWTWITVYQNPRCIEITHDPLIFWVAQGIFWLSSERLSRCTLHLIEGVTGESVLLYYVVLEPCCPASTPLWGIVTKSPKVQTSTYIIHLSDQSHIMYICRNKSRISIARGAMCMPLFWRTVPLQG